ncbi:uncharacterized protein LOC132737558 [Ruditapes philippinarum]|uniref:uncharacterized protein LOC132737558 n=1 Tax=Ruditapes philippinarum TaxID=129788 RepID=UPI00295A7A69|nr:uncharacterized protein LOC132737558 [Ruditapes philippinarum]
MGFREKTELDTVNQRNTKEYIPAIVVISIVLSSGLILNSFASLFYGRQTRKSAFQIFVLSLSVNFLITNLVLLHDIVELFYFVQYESVAACKLFYVLKHWFVGNSLFFMVAIGFDRYRTVCFPFSKALTLRTAWCVILGLSVFSLGISVSLFSTTDIVRMNITTSHNSTIHGHTCTFSESENLQTLRVINHFVDVSLHGIILSLFVFFYTFITRKLIITRKKVKGNVSGKLKMEVYKIGSAEHSEITSDISTKCEEISEEHPHANTDISMGNRHKEQSTKQFNEKMTNTPSNNKNPGLFNLANKKNHDERTEIVNNGNIETGETGVGRSKDTLSRKKRAKNKSRWERRITIMATVKTVSSIACFVPFYVSMMIITPKLHGDGLVLDVGSIIARRSFMLNSAINPIIMIIFNDAFRQYLKGTLHKVTSKFRVSYRSFK